MHAHCNLKKIKINANSIIKNTISRRKKCIIIMQP